MSAPPAITVRIDSGVDLPFFPTVFGQDGRPSFSLDATHTVPIGQYVETGAEGDEGDDDLQEDP